MLYGYIGCAVTLVAIFAIPANMGEFAQYAWFFIAYTLLNAVFYTANNIAYSALTALVTKNSKERVQMGSYRFIFAFSTSLLIQSLTIGFVEWMGGGAAGWRMVAIVYAVIGLVVNTISVFSVKELPEEELNDGKASGADEKYSLIDAGKLLFTNKYYVMICATYILQQIYTAMLNMGIYYMTYILFNENLYGVFSWAINIPLIILLCISSIYNNKLYIEDFFTFLNLEENIENEGVKIQKIKEIEFDNVSFSYKDTDRAILKNISLKINSSKPIAIIGENGSGKTTIIKLLAGLYKTYNGDIRINGINLKSISPEAYKRKLGIVFQDFNKYELSIRENIGLADTEKMNSDNEIFEVLKTVGMNKEFGDDLDVQMGNWFGGRELSKGQWQRIAIARSLIRDSDVLVLDEPTAALDPIMEREIFQLIKNISKEKILIFITHRVSNLLELDPYIFIMENGRIVSSGSQQQLKDDIHFNRLLTGNNEG